MARAESPDRPIVLALAVAYLAAAAAVFPVTEWPRAVGGAAAAFAGVHAIGGRWRGTRIVPHATVAVAFALIALLVMPTFGAMGGRNGADLAIGALGTQVGLLLFGVASWMPKRPRRRRVPFGAIQFGAAFAALGLSVIATIPVVIALVADPTRGVALLLVYPAYFVGCAAAGAILWCSQRIQHLATGRYLGGVLAAACLYGAVAPVVAILEREPMSFGTGLLLALCCGGLLGPALAFDKTFG